MSYYVGRPSRDLVTAARQQVTREWWEENRQAFDAYISALVLEEAGGGEPSAATKRLDALEGMPILSLTTEIEDLAAVLTEDGPIPENHAEDALHIAIASIHGMDFLLTWKYECPVICSPEELVGEES